MTRFHIYWNVIDWEMPVTNGLRFSKAVRNGDGPHYVYVIMVTAHNLPTDAIYGLTVGVGVYVPKAFRPNELVIRVNTGNGIVDVLSGERSVFALPNPVESRDPETGAHFEGDRSYDAGKHRDPVIVEAFIDVEDKFDRFQERYTVIEAEPVVGKELQVPVSAIAMTEVEV